MATQKQRRKKYKRRRSSAGAAAEQRSEFRRRANEFNKAVAAQARRLEDSTSRPTKHHWVPKTYLRHWATTAGDERIRATDLESRKSFLNIPANLACKDHLYRIELDEVPEDELPPLTIESLLGSIEGEATPTLQRLVRHEVDMISLDQMAFFALFLAFQKVRSPSALRRQQELESKIATQILIAETTDPEAREAFASGQFRVAKPTGVYAGQMGRLAQDIAPHLFARTWVLFRTAPTMMTCDEPVVLVPAPGRARRIRPGLTDAGVVLFPISPEAVLALFQNKFTPSSFEVAVPRIQVGSLSESDTEELNLEVAMAANRWVFEAPPNQIGQSFDLPPLPSEEWPFRGDFHTGDQVCLDLPTEPTRWSHPAWENHDLPVTSWWTP